MTQHTAGPWRAVLPDGGEVWFVYGPHELRIRVGLDDENSRPNARLIAAAPDLFAALEDCVLALTVDLGDEESWEFERRGTWEEVAEPVAQRHEAEVARCVEAARAALVKARGEG